MLQSLHCCLIFPYLVPLLHNTCQGVEFYLFSHLFRMDFIIHSSHKKYESHLSNLVSVLLTQRQKDAEDRWAMCLYWGTIRLRHSFTCPQQGQAFLCVKKWFEAEMSRIIPDVFSHFSHFVCFYNFNYIGSCGPGIIGILRDSAISRTAIE